MVKRRRLLSPTIWMLAVPLLGCHDDRDGFALGRPCSDDAACGSGYRCALGRCRLPCETHNDCQRGACLPPVAGEGPSCTLPAEESCEPFGCPSGFVCDSSRTCLRACSVTRNCEGGYQCAGGICRLSEEVPAPDSSFCPTVGGPTMKLLPGGFCIDRTEVTRAQYAIWLATDPKPASDADPCEWNDSLLPAYYWPPFEAEGLLPVVGVDWCDAAAFCRDAGKLLCGHPDGSSGDWNEPADAASSAWYAACSSGGRWNYTYGDDYDASACNVYNNAASRCQTGKCELAACGALPSCQSKETGYESVSDLTGNAWEWEDACETSWGADDRCRVRGGSVNNRDSYVTCNVVLGPSENPDARRNATNDSIGFRCCARPVSVRDGDTVVEEGEGI
jgi:formylglycine-generating enzyme required for sulfatase activity/ubiquitin